MCCMTFLSIYPSVANYAYLTTNSITQFTKLPSHLTMFVYLFSLAYKCNIFFILALQVIQIKLFQAFTSIIIPLLSRPPHKKLSLLHLSLRKICISEVCSGNMMTQFLLMTSFNSSSLRRSPLCANKYYEVLILFPI